MRRNQTNLQLLDGLRPSNSVTMPVAQPRPRTLARPSGEPPLVSVLTAMERRLSALQADRTRLGSTLHNEVLQTLYAMEESLIPMRQTAPVTPRAVDQRHPHLVGQLHRLIQEVRQLIRKLDQEGVRDFELTEELRSLQAAYTQLGHVRLTLHLHPAAIEVLTQEEGRALLAIVRETLDHCLRQEPAPRASVSLRRHGATVRLCIRHHGTGVDSGGLLRDGLAMLAARARKIGGTVRIEPAPAHGTQVLVEFSLEPLLVSV